MQSDILFDNIYIGHSVEDAEKLKVETFDVKHAIEKAEEIWTDLECHRSERSRLSRLGEECIPLAGTASLRTLSEGSRLG